MNHFGTAPPARASTSNTPVSNPDSSPALLIVAGTRESPLPSTAMAATPSNVPCTEPTPPKMLVPPSTTAVMAASS